MAEALTQMGRADEAFERISSERVALDAAGVQLWIPELVRVAADTLLIARPDAAKRAEALLDEADAMATTQGVPMLRLRLARSRLLLSARTGTGHVSHACGRLRQALNAIPEPDDSADLIDARQTLDAMLLPRGTQ